MRSRTSKLQRLLLILAALLGSGISVSAQLSPAAARQLEQAAEALKAGRAEDASRLSATFLLQHPTHAAAHRIHGHALFDLGRQEEARSAYLRALAEGGLTSDVLARLTEIARRESTLGGTEAGAQLLTLLDAENPGWKLLLAESRRRLGQLSSARALYEELLGSRPDDAETWIRLANLDVASEAPGAAATKLTIAWHLGYTKGNLAARIATLHAQARNARSCLEWLERARAQREAIPPRLDLTAALLLAEDGDEEGALKLLRSRLETAEAGLRGEIHRALAGLLVRRGSLEAGVRHLHRASECGVEDPKTLRYLGAHHARRGEHEEAAGWWERALRLDPEDADLRAHAVRSRHRAGHRDRARKHLLRYLESHGRDERAVRLIRFLRTKP